MDTGKIRRALMLFMGIIAFGTCGYYFFENMPIFDAFYMTIITVSTVGFSEIHPLTMIGRSITIIVIVLGISVGTYTIGIIVQYLVGGEIQKIFGRRKLQKQIAQLKNHFIICGFGRIGSIICQELFEEKINFVVIEENHAAMEDMAAEKYLFLEMDATSEEALMKAGIMTARGIVTVVDSDANNVFITLTAKGLRPDIFVLARASEEKNEGKLLKAGATRVVSPYMIGARRMAHVLKRPTVIDFINLATMENQLGLIMEEAVIDPKSSFCGKNLIDSRLRQNFGVIIVAIKKLSGQMIFNPQPSEILEAGDVIVVIGKKEDVKRMNQII
jgi:voltage-gated potassium channel